MLTVSLLLLVGAFMLTVASAAWGKVPLWTAVVLLCLWGLLTVLPR